MSDKDKNAKKEYFNKASAEKAMETAKNKFNANWKVIVGILILAVILLNTLWNSMENKISESVTKEIASFKSELAKLDARVSEAEKGTIDLDAVKDDITSIKKAGEDFGNKLNALVKAEEEKLARLEKDAENQKAYINELKSLLK